MQLDRVALVFDPAFGSALAALVARCHVWLVETPPNAEAAAHYWAEAAQRQDPAHAATELTTFKLPGPTVEAALDAILEMIEEHHGEFAEGPTVRQVLLVGIEPTAAMLETLSGWDYSACTSTAEGTLCVRS